MSHPNKLRRSQLPGAGRHSRSRARISDVVLAVTLVALFGVCCLYLLANLAAADEGIVAVPMQDQAS